MSGTQQGVFVNLNIAVATAAANQHPDRLRAPVGRKVRGSEISLHPPQRFVGSRHQTDTNRLLGDLAHLLRTQVRDNTFYLAEYGVRHGTEEARNMTRNLLFHSSPTPTRSTWTCGEKYRTINSFDG